MALGTVDCEGVALPLPDGWQIPEGGRSYVGNEGLLDVRLVPNGAAIDDERLRIARERLEATGGTAAIVSVQGRPCLTSEYRKGDSLVLTYSFDVGSGHELVAVYVFSDAKSPWATRVHRFIATERNDTAMTM
jgi:hypothetical protein